MEANNNNRLQELSGSNYEIADGQPNIKGWDINVENGTIGKVHGLVFEEVSRKVRYIITTLDKDFTNAASRSVLVPIGLAELHKEDDVVLLPGVTRAQLLSLPEYEKDNLTDANQDEIRNAFATGSTAGMANNETGSFYDHQHFDENNLYKNRSSDNATAQSIPVIKEELQVGKQEVQTGGIRLKSRIVETPVEKDITLREENVSVERTPVDRAATNADLTEDTIEMKETAEVPVVSKESRIVEEVSLKKEVSEREHTIKDSVKETEIDIERTGDGGYTKDTTD